MMIRFFKEGCDRNDYHDLDMLIDIDDDTIRYQDISNVLRKKVKESLSNNKGLLLGIDSHIQDILKISNTIAKDLNISLVMLEEQ